MNTQDTTDLVVSAVSGDRQAFGILVTRYAAMVTGIAYAVCGDFARSEDVGQEAFVEAWKNLATLREPEKFAAWICTIARRRAIDDVRAASTSKSICSIDNLPFELSDPNQHSPESGMSQKQDRELVWSMLENLPEDYREPMVLFYRCEQSTRDVAIALGEGESTIRQRLKRGREMIRSDVSEIIRQTLCETAPKAAFAAVVIASLPSATYAAGATAATTALTGKSTGMGSVAVSSAMGGAAFGSLVGVTGGVFGTWMSWKNCEYESQQRFIIRQAVIFTAVMAGFGILLAILINVRTHGFMDSDNLYGCLLVGLILGFQGFNVVWIFRSIRGYRQIGERAKAGGQPMRESVRLPFEQLRQQSQVHRADGTIGYEAFRWNAWAWGGSSLGGLAWMLPTTGLAFWNGSTLTGAVIGGCFLVGCAVAIMLWRARGRIHAYAALQTMIGIMCGLTTVAMVTLQFSANEETLAGMKWTPLAYLVLLIFPLLSLQFYSIRRSFQKNMLKRDVDDT
ncbi:MAG: sigma-70 family RNA polymerase sigma factor [Planctomycetota bacterium]|nr:sigma-70 family RNA polymerase sigma factor [Planctomycetota bacterium]